MTSTLIRVAGRPMRTGSTHGAHVNSAGNTHAVSVCLDMPASITTRHLDAKVNSLQSISAIVNVKILINEILRDIVLRKLF